MSGVVIWDNADQTILHLRFKDIVTLTEYARVVGQTNTILHSVAHKVHLLIDARDAWVANGYLNGNTPQLARGDFDTRGMVVIVGGDQTIKALMLRATLPEAPQFVSSLDEAYRLLSSGAAH